MVGVESKYRSNWLIAQNTWSDKTRDPPLERVEWLVYGAREVIQVFVVMMMLRQCEVELATAGQEGKKRSRDVVVVAYGIRKDFSAATNPLCNLSACLR